jgi:hypothetical protein
VIVRLPPPVGTTGLVPGDVNASTVMLREVAATDCQVGNEDAPVEVRTYPMLEMFVEAL